eukprot:15485359-Alexandrium_andersonii.AAC.1
MVTGLRTCLISGTPSTWATLLPSASRLPGPPQWQSRWMRPSAKSASPLMVLTPLQGAPRWVGISARAALGLPWAVSASGGVAWGSSTS